MKNKKQPNLNYAPSMEWKKVGPLAADANDGSRMVLDIRGLVHYFRPDTYSLICGIEMANGKEPHNKSFGPPPKNKPLVLYTERRLNLWRDGYDTDYFLSQKQTKLFIISMKEALKKIGYKINILGTK